MIRRLALMAAAVTSLLACGGGMTNTGTNPTTDDSQTPPTTGRADIEAWIAKGTYKSWHCESAPHAARSPSPHGINRICSNDKESSAAKGSAIPVDGAGVKELYDSTGTSIVGYAVYRRVTDGTGGDAFYWYERVPLTSAAPHDSNGTVADGMGSSGPPQTICVACHQGGDNFTYTRVTP